MDQFRAYQEFLAAEVGASAFAGLGDRGAELAAAVLPDFIPTAAGHGDYAPRNMFLDNGGRLTVFDPLPRFAVPAQDDLCRFLVGVRLLGLQLHTHGVAYSAADLERRESAVIAGYYADRPVPAAELRCYQAMIMLDKWSALVQPAGRRLSTRVQTLLDRPGSPLPGRPGPAAAGSRLCGRRRLQPPMSGDPPEEAHTLRSRTGHAAVPPGPVRDVSLPPSSRRGSSPRSFSIGGAVVLRDEDSGATPKGGSPQAPPRAFTAMSWWNAPLPDDPPLNPAGTRILEYLRTAPESGAGCLTLAGAGDSPWGQPVYRARPGDREYDVTGIQGAHPPELENALAFLMTPGRPTTGTAA